MIECQKFQVQQVDFVNDLRLWGLRPKSRGDNTRFDI